MFKQISNKLDSPSMEKGILEFWDDNNIFLKTQDSRNYSKEFNLYEGPPTANGSPGIHHVLARVFKDIIPRYKTMKGYRTTRKGGWDTHGLPVELEIEKKLGLKTKHEIENYGIEKFNQKCKESVFQYVSEWENMTKRIGYWVDMSNPYVTLSNEYIESGWWIFSKLWEKELVYRDLKGTPHCPRCVTSLSSHEVALGYKENTKDPSVFIKFKIKDFSPSFADSKSLPPNTPVFFLAWTTTPWTLPGNTALAINENAKYSLVLLEKSSPEILIIASSLVEKTITEPYSIITTITGNQLTTTTYFPLYDPVENKVEITNLGNKSSAQDPYVLSADFVDLNEGTGIVHIAPGFGAEDLELGKKEGLNFIQHVNLQGKIIGNYSFSGKFVKSADSLIITELENQNLLYKNEIYLHSYPYCWRCDSPLLYYAKYSWYVKTTEFKTLLLKENEKINGYPVHIKTGRFGEWLKNNVDWAISRERYWGTPLPIWICKKCKYETCINSIKDLREQASETINNKNLDLHRPYIDNVSLKCPECKDIMTRTPEVLDAWYDSGAMPFAQHNTTSDLDLKNLQNSSAFPADYICEAIDQTRGWFYTLHAISTMLTGSTSFNNVICLGHILDEKGQKMSKHIGNVVNPWSILDNQGADALRWYLLTANQPGEPRRFSQNLVNEIVRKFLLTLWNTYSFFITYARIDKFSPNNNYANSDPKNPLDKWILGELNLLIKIVDDSLDQYNPTEAGRKIQEFVDILSNWYVRRSRRRFWKSDNDQDKIEAYNTLYKTLTTLTHLIAPFTPFMAEEIYQNLVRNPFPDSAESVHLSSFPNCKEDLIDNKLIQATRTAMRVASMGRAARSKAGIKVRQPLPEILIKATKEEENSMHLILDQIQEELNVKTVSLLNTNPALLELIKSKNNSDDTFHEIDSFIVTQSNNYIVAIDTSLNEELLGEGIARDFVHNVQSQRKKLGFELTDRISIYHNAPPEVMKLFKPWTTYISEETLADAIEEKSESNMADNATVFKWQNEKFLIEVKQKSKT